MKFIWLLLLMAVAVIDFQYRKVKNILIVLMFFLGVFFIFLNKNPFYLNIFDGLVGAGFVFLIFLIFYRFKWMGAGDVKFAGVLGLWMGLSSGLVVVLLGATVFAMLHAVWEIFISRKTSFAIEKENIKNIFNQKEKNKSIPYAGYMAVAAILWMMSGHKSVYLLSV